MDTGARSSAATMRAAVIAKAGTAAIETVPMPQPGASQVRVRLEGSGVCGSNLPTWQGREWFRYPIDAGAPGHEGWGVVDAVGESVIGVRPGQRVALLSGRAFAEYDVADEDSVVVLPPQLDGRPFPGEPLGCAMNIHRRSAIRPGQTVAIIGIGFLGALATRLAKDAGARVIAITRRPWALELARQYGADELVQMDDHQRVIDRVRELTGGGFCERVVELVGEQWPLDLAGELTGVRGRLVIAGYHQDSPRRVNMQLWNWRGLDVVNAHERDPKVYVEGIRMAVDAVASGKLDPFPLLTHEVPLGDLPRAFELMQSRPDGFVKALVVP